MTQESNEACWVCGAKISATGSPCPECGAPQDDAARDAAKRYLIREIESLRDEGLIANFLAQHLTGRYTRRLKPRPPAPPPSGVVDVPEQSRAESGPAVEVSIPGVVRSKDSSLPDSAGPISATQVGMVNNPLTLSEAVTPTGGAAESKGERAVHGKHDEGRAHDGASLMVRQAHHERMEHSESAPVVDPATGVERRRPVRPALPPAPVEIFSERNIKILLYLGVFVLLVSVLVFIHSRWSAIPDFIKLALVASLTVASGSAGAVLARRGNLYRTGIAFLILSLATISLDVYASWLFGYVTATSPVQLWIGSSAVTMLAAAALARIFAEPIFAHLAASLATFLVFLLLKENDAARASYPVAFAVYSALIAGVAYRMRPFWRIPVSVQSSIAIVLSICVAIILMALGQLTSFQVVVLSACWAAALEFHGRGLGWLWPLALQGAVLLPGVIRMAQWVSLPPESEGFILSLAGWIMLGAGMWDREAGRASVARGRLTSSATLTICGLWLSVGEYWASASPWTAAAFFSIGGLAIAGATLKQSKLLGTAGFLLVGAGLHQLGRWLGTPPLWRPHLRLSLACALMAAQGTYLSRTDWLASSLRYAARILAAAASLNLLYRCRDYLNLGHESVACAGAILCGIFLYLDAHMSKRSRVADAGNAFLALGIPFGLAAIGLRAEWIATGWGIFACGLLNLSPRLPDVLAISGKRSGLALALIMTAAALIDGPALLAHRDYVPLEVPLGLFLLIGLPRGRESRLWSAAMIGVGWILETVLARHAGLGWKYMPALWSVTACALIAPWSPAFGPRVARFLAVPATLQLAMTLPALIGMRAYIAAEVPLAALCLLVATPRSFGGDRRAIAAASVCGTGFVLVATLHSGAMLRVLPLVLATLSIAYLLASTRLVRTKAAAASGLGDASYAAAVVAVVSAYYVSHAGFRPHLPNVLIAALIAGAVPLIVFALAEQSVSASYLAGLALLAAYRFILHERGLAWEAQFFAGFAAALVLRLASRRASPDTAFAQAWNNLATLVTVLVTVIFIVRLDHLYRYYPAFALLASLTAAAEAFSAAWPTPNRSRLWRGFLHGTAIVFFVIRWLNISPDALALAHAELALAINAGIFIAIRLGRLPTEPAARGLVLGTLHDWSRVEALIGLTWWALSRHDAGWMPVAALAVLCASWALDERVKGERAALWLAVLHLILFQYAALGEAGWRAIDRSLAGSVLGIAAILAAAALPAGNLRRWIPPLIAAGLILTTGEAIRGNHLATEGQRTLQLILASAGSFIVIARGFGLPAIIISALALHAGLFLEFGVGEGFRALGIQPPRLALAMMLVPPALLAAGVRLHRTERRAAAVPLIALALLLPLAAAIQGRDSLGVLSLIALASAAHYAAASAALGSPILLYAALSALAASYAFLLRQMGVPLVRMPPYLLSYALAKVLVSGRRESKHPLSITAMILPALVLASMLAGGTVYLGSEEETAIVSTFLASLAYAAAAWRRGEVVYAAPAAGCFLSSYYLLLHRYDVAAWEFYTVPPALLLIGWSLRLIRRGGVWSNEILGAGLFLLLMPSLERSLHQENVGSAFFLAVASLAVLAGGMRLRRKVMAAAGLAGMMADVVIQGIRYIHFGAVPKSLWGILFGMGIIAAGVMLEQKRHIALKASYDEARARMKHYLEDWK